MAMVYAGALLWINLYICRDLFRTPTGFMNSMQGFWIGLAKHAGHSWFQVNWWPYWDCGMPFEFAYAPLVPGLIAAWTAIAKIPGILAFQSITGVVYCLIPLTLFAMGWLLMRSPGAAFAASLFYSLAAPTNLIVPDVAFSWKSFWDARRFYIAAVWDETPHLTALALLPIAILFLIASLQRRRLRYYVPTIVLIALMALASEFGPMEIILAAICLLFVFQREALWRNIAITAALGALGYAIVLPFLPPSLLGNIGKSAGSDGETVLNLGSFTAIAIVVLGWAILAQYLPRWTADWRVQFLAYFAYLTASIPIIAEYLHRQFLPQPGRYRSEMEVSLALLLAFGLRPWFRRMRMPVRIALAFLLLSIAGEQIATLRHYAKITIVPRDLTQTIEYRTSVQAQLAGGRVMLPGSISHWANAFSDVQQFSGGSWSKATNPAQQLGLAAVTNGGATLEADAQVSLAWLKAYGVSAVAVSGPHSQEYWKPYGHPTKFEGVLPAIWRADDVTLYRVPQRIASFAHVVPEAAIVRHMPKQADDVAEIESYVRALDDPALPPADMQWKGLNRALIRTSAGEGEAISVQMSYHPGWQAQAMGRKIPVRADGLGLMWLNPECNGPCEIELSYEGGWEIRLSRYISFTVIGALVLAPLIAAVRRRRLLAHS